MIFEQKTRNNKKYPKYLLFSQQSQQIQPESLIWRIWPCCVFSLAPFSLASVCLWWISHPQQLPPSDFRLSAHLAAQTAACEAEYDEPRKARLPKTNGFVTNSLVKRWRLKPFVT